MSDAARPAVRGALGDTAAVLGTFLVVGVLAGIAWWLLVDPAVYTSARGGAAMGELELAKRFAVDGWYSVLAVVAGFPAGVGLTWWRSRDPRLTTLLLLPGAALAAATTSYVGGLLGPDDPGARLEGAARGQTFPVELAVTAYQAHLMWPIAVLAGALMVLWSSDRRGTATGAARSPAPPRADPVAWTRATTPPRRTRKPPCPPTSRRPPSPSTSTPAAARPRDEGARDLHCSRRRPPRWPASSAWAGGRRCR